ncbi:hypothetical protein AQJ43_09095 [Streptomyces avermitilis]|uniref:Uncharacterized protein n=2 Tax=Streptomyces avermitilis TaxID=33903 RepID=Q82N13_STRAW|nr:MULTISPECIES: DUF6421 family protein [Streptomyces]KUN55095.1 hypothetical protein AQJ43_09095 [Streptomyces avermitilis]MYS97121.1 hypothetical protein [Streptomyces sp. SID5469]OOV24605.1 hypothetical protein SM007_29645 [Streptomyces avermitilis]BAC69200.1 hypothetical protein SAVERM_1490 [Streptomyces avermitilis MA-4680 = NBRC 14893]BBJ49156.1 hypothetical protein SAVMC3_17850 [Streptomyces avermitilis]
MTEILVQERSEEQVPPQVRVVEHPAWPVLKDAVEQIRPWQSKDGSIDFEAEGAPDASDAELAVRRAIDAVEELSPLLPHDAAYHAALVKDLRRWSDDGFKVPDFLDSLLAFQPAGHRRDGLQHLVVFPMYTQNGNPDRNFEAVVLRMVWPDWLAELEATRYDNPLFCGITFEDFTAGYDTNSAVLFPETIAVREAPERFSWGGIFCDREAARFRAVTDAAVDTLGLELPADIAAMVHDQQRCEQAFVLWDMVHDRTHSHGDLPFDPFMIKQRQPFWMYGLEELRCDLTAFKEAVKLEADGFPQGRDVQYAVLFDRMFRFPVTGERVRNYDGLGGQLLFAYLHKHDVVRWTDNKLHIDWQRAPQVTNELCAEIEDLYRAGIDRPKLVHWFKAYELVSTYLAPHPGSRWAKGPDALDLTQPPRKLVDDVLPDEFPLSMFYEALAKKLKNVIASTKGITATSAERAAA